MTNVFHDIDIDKCLDKRSVRIYRMRTEQKKTFHAIAAAVGVSKSRAHQIYQSSCKQIELRSRFRADHPQFCLSHRAQRALLQTFHTIGVKRTQVRKPLIKGELRPGCPHWYGEKTHREMCKWAGSRPEDCTVPQRNT